MRLFDLFIQKAIVGEGGGTAPTLISKSINENGTYNASSDNADGYSSVSVNVSDTMETLLMGQATYIKSNATYIPLINYIYSTNTWLLNVQFISFRNNEQGLNSDFMRSGNFNTTLKYVNIGNCPEINNNCFFAQTGVKSLILIKSDGVCTAYNKDAIDCCVRGSAIAYVPDSLKSSYQAATNWATVADKIKGFSEANAYDATTTYSIGDVCKYNDKFYGYCKKDLTSSTGNAPSGTTDDNAYWEYVADIEVA